MPDFTENDLRDIERDRDLPPDEPHPRTNVNFECERCGCVFPIVVDAGTYEPGEPPRCPECGDVFGAQDDPVIVDEGPAGLAAHRSMRFR